MNTFLPIIFLFVALSATSQTKTTVSTLDLTPIQSADPVSVRVNGYLLTFDRQTLLGKYREDASLNAWLSEEPIELDSLKNADYSAHYQLKQCISASLESGNVQIVTPNQRRLRSLKFLYVYTKGSRRPGQSYFLNPANGEEFFRYLPVFRYVGCPNF